MALVASINPRVIWVNAFTVLEPALPAGTGLAIES
ncbi:MAG: hypothetical protein RIS09_569 [Actinomycetota bacterium]|jgi:hypothetical protein